MHVSDEGRVSGIYKELLRVNNMATQMWKMEFEDGPHFLGAVLRVTPGQGTWLTSCSS